MGLGKHGSVRRSNAWMSSSWVSKSISFDFTSESSVNSWELPGNVTPRRHCFDYIYRCCTIGGCLGIDSLSCSLQSRCIQRVHDREEKQFLKEHLHVYDFFLNLHVSLFIWLRIWASWLSSNPIWKTWVDHCCPDAFKGFMTARTNNFWRSICIFTIFFLICIFVFLT